jgi:hypothetical protein
VDFLDKHISECPAGPCFHVVGAWRFSVVHMSECGISEVQNRLLVLRQAVFWFRVRRFPDSPWEYASAFQVHASF